MDYDANCGNMSSAVGPFAVDERLVPVGEGQALVRIHNTNTNKVIHARFPVADGRAVVTGDLALPGVPGTAAAVRLDFLDPGGSRTGALLPTGRVVDDLVLRDGCTVSASLVDAASPCVLVRADEIGLTGVEHPDELDARQATMHLLEQIRRTGGVRMGLGATPGDVPMSTPKIMMVSGPALFRSLAAEVVAPQDHDLGVRMLSMERTHRAVTVTGALCLAVAARVAGTVVHAVADGAAPLRIGNPSGVVVVDAVMDGAHPVSAALLRTTRRLMQGQVVVPGP